MAYCVVNDVKSEFKSIDFDAADAAVTSSDVTEFITQASNEIDARIAARYAVPVTTGTAALSTLKMICTWLVAQRVRDIVETKTVRAETTQEVKRNTRDEALKLLSDIASGKIDLIGATLASSDQGVKSYVSTNNIQRVFKKDTDQW